jgi:hypothetical protein
MLPALGFMLLISRIISQDVSTRFCHYFKGFVQELKKRFLPFGNVNLVTGMNVSDLIVLLQYLLILLHFMDKIYPLCTFSGFFCLYRNVYRNHLVRRRTC